MALQITPNNRATGTLSISANQRARMASIVSIDWDNVFGTIFATPSASVGLTAQAGAAATAMRSDGAPAIDQSIQPTWTSTHTFSNRINITPTASIGARALTATQSISSATAAGARSMNLINITSDDAPAGTGNFIVGFNAQSSAGGSNYTGNRTAAQFSQGLTTASNWDGDIVGSYSIGSATATFGGTATTALGAKGHVYGFASWGNISGTATNVHIVSGGEVNVHIGTGATARRKTGLQIIEHSLDVVDAADINAGLMFSSQASSIKLSDGILFSTVAGQAILKDGGTILRSDASQTVLNGIDLTNFTVTGSAFKSTGYTLDGSGNITSGAWQGTAVGVSYGGTGTTSTAGVQALIHPGLMYATISGVDFNSANTDHAIVLQLPSGMTRFNVFRVDISHASGTLTTSTWGLYSAAAAGGVALTTVGATNTVSTASDATANNMMSVGPTVGATMSFVAASLATANTLYFRVGTAQGSAATADVTLLYYPLP